ncbi:MAG: hypothetical protein ACR2K9_03895 [Solirubrobacteraceae bacterium]
MSAFARIAARRVPALAVLDAARRIYRHGSQGWRALTPSEQQELGRLLRISRRGPSALGPHDRAELRRIVLKAGRGAAFSRGRR